VRQDVGVGVAVEAELGALELHPAEDEPAAVNVKASTGEGMGFVGRLEGVAALAVATVIEVSR
jgi:2C-methyl-D-erythritol 2,4-cyclodiphosphate synthase